MLPTNVLYYGCEDELPERRHLRAGPLSLQFEQGDLRYIRFGEREIVRRLYVATRDRNWGTAPTMLSNVQMDVRDDNFRIRYDCSHRLNDIDFQWRGELIGDGQGTITFSMDGVARSTFLRNRIGFCILHPVRECAGQPCVVEHPDGAREQGVFPQFIAPHQPFKEIQAISYEVMPDVHAEMRFDGDIFEMEDQRNWTDASFKTYCTPLRLPIPATVEAGTRITQSVTLQLHTQSVLQEDVGHVAPGEVTISLQPERHTALPRIGLGAASHGQPLSMREIERLRALHLSHLRVDLDLTREGYGEDLRRAATEAEALGVPLEVAVFVSDQAASELQMLAQKVLPQVRVRAWAWLVFHVAEKSTSAQWVELARQHLHSFDPDARFGTGTNAYFTELNRTRPPTHLLGLVCYPITPQVHAFDNASLVETAAAQAITVESARQFANGRPIVVSPVTLKMRFNPDASGPELPPAPGQLPRQVDVRQMSLFGAGWTLASMKYLAESGCASVTYYETTGWRGVMETARGSALPDQFR
jgi:hypothetical protein